MEFWRYMNVLITGSSGYVASELIPLLRANGHECVGVDRIPSQYTSRSQAIEHIDISKTFDGSMFSVLHLAAARIDFGVTAENYYDANVFATRKFLDSLSPSRIDMFVHFSSVAAFDGEKIRFCDDLNCDDAYRSTKFLQDQEVIEWCKNHSVPLAIIYPSAIFDDRPRLDTNIGTLQRLARLLPVIPDIKIKKSLTYLPALAGFAVEILENRQSGKFMCIEQPVKTVADILTDLRQGHRTLKIPAPGLSIFLFTLAYILQFLTLGKVDTKLTPGRIKKLFSDTSYSNVRTVNQTSYNSYLRPGVID